MAVPQNRLDGAGKDSVPAANLKELSIPQLHFLSCGADCGNHFIITSFISRRSCVHVSYSHVVCSNSSGGEFQGSWDRSPHLGEFEIFGLGEILAVSVIPKGSWQCQFLEIPQGRNHDR